MDSIKTNINESVPLQFVVGTLIGFFIILIIIFVKYIIYRIYRNSKSHPYLVKGNIQASKSLIVYQDPSDKDSVPIIRSRDEKNGIEFSYTVWLNVTDWINYKKGEWKHVFHKGSSYSSPEDDSPYGMVASPGLWFHPDSNTLRIYMNTFNNMNEFVDVSNIPSNKWYHLSIVVKGTSLNIYINGFLKMKHTMSGLPRQNFGNGYVAMNGGFSGFIADLQYHNYSLTPSEIQRFTATLPSTLSCNDTSGGSPPYLNTNWWQTNYNN